MSQLELELKSEEKTFSIKPGDPFYISAPTTENQCVLGRKQNSPHIQKMIEEKKLILETLNDVEAVKISTGKASEDELNNFFSGLLAVVKFGELSEKKKMREFLSAGNFRVSGNAHLLRFLKEHEEIEGKEYIKNELIQAINMRSL